MTQFKKGDIVKVVDRKWGNLNGKKGRVVFENGDEPTVEFDDPHRRADIHVKYLKPMNDQEKVTTTRENIIRAYERADENGKETLRELYPETIGNAFPDLVKMPESITNCIDDPVMIGCSCAPKEMEEHCLLLKKGWGTWKLEEHPENSDFLILYCEKK